MMRARVGAVARVVAVRLVVDGSVGALRKREPPTVGVHEFAEVRGVDARAKRGVGHAHGGQTVCVGWMARPLREATRYLRQLSRSTRE